MRTVTLFSAQDLEGSLQILPVLFHRLARAEQGLDTIVADLLRIGGLKPVLTCGMPVADEAEEEEFLACLAEATVPQRTRVILDHVTGGLWLDRADGRKRRTQRAGTIQDAFLHRFHADVPEMGTLAVQFTSREREITALILNRAIPSMSLSEARIAMTRPQIIMKFPMLIALLVGAIKAAATRHGAINEGSVADDAVLTAEHLVENLTITALHQRAA